MVMVIYTDAHRYSNVKLDQSVRNEFLSVFLLSIILRFPTGLWVSHNVSDSVGVEWSFQRYGELICEQGPSLSLLKQFRHPTYFFCFPEGWKVLPSYFQASDAVSISVPLPFLMFSLFFYISLCFHISPCPFFPLYLCSGNHRFVSTANQCQCWRLS